MAPWSEAQVKTARAVSHGWKPKGSAKGFSLGFARDVISEGVKGAKKRKAAKKYGLDK